MQQFHKQILEREKVHHRFHHGVQDSGREVNISVWSVEVPRTSGESVRCCNISSWQEDKNIWDIW